MKATDRTNQYVVKALTAIFLSDILKKKKEPFFRGYTPRWYFKTAPIRHGDKYEM